MGVLALQHGRQPEHILGFEPATRKDLYLAHDPAYVDDVLDLRRDNGFGNRDPRVAAALPYTTGSMIAAAEHALRHGGHVCSPTSGFHHASYDSAWGFCTLNGLAVAALVVAMQGAKVGILDCDAHEGDGTADILRRIKGHGIKHHTLGAHFPCRQRAEDGEFLHWLRSAIDDLSDCDVVLYQAGADAWERDPLGGQLRNKLMELREFFVFSGLKNVAWNLAGGYVRDKDGGISSVLSLHTKTLFWSNRDA
ncbi:MAG: hypothetical protein ACK40S_13125 [Burkholderiaceae bacterium]